MLLLVLAVVLPLVIAARASVSRRAVQVNHVLLFTLGYLIYWVGPVAFGRLRFFDQHPALRIWYDFYDAGARRDSFSTYLLFIVLMYLAFVLGSALGTRLRLYSAGRALARWRFDGRLLGGYLLASALLTAALAWALRPQLFTGYAAIYTSATLGRGTLAACSLLLLGLLLIRLANPDRAISRRLSARSLLSNPFLLAYVGSAVLLLGTGGRLYVVSAVFMLLTYLTVYHGRIGLTRALALALAVLVGAGAVGLLRLQHSVSTLGVAANLFSEPLFTSFSLLRFLGDGQLPLINFPRFLLGDLLNLIPSAVLPSKAEFLANPEDFGYTIFSPFGAFNSFVSFMVNFGLLGSLACLFALGTGLAVLKRQNAPVAQVSYSMLSGCLAFTFFRDPFSVSIVKNMLEFSILVPWTIVLSLHLVSIAGRAGRPRQVAAGQA